MTNTENPGDLDHHLGAMMDVYEDEHKRYWMERLGEEEWSRRGELRATVDEVAQQIIAASHQMVLPEATETTDLMKDVVRDYRQEEYLQWVDLIGRVGSRIPPETLAALRRNDPRESDEVEELEERPVGDSALRVLWERFCVELARDIIDNRLARAANRQLTLAQLLVAANPPKPTSQFLRHVSQCYIWGFDTECVVLCRIA